jgi:ribose transport system substrate-binding protein
MEGRQASIRRARLWAALLAVTAVGALGVAACGSSGSGSGGGGGGGGGADVAKKGQYTIALSNSFLGNTWRQTMVKVFQHTAKEAQQQGLIKGYKVENTGQNTATEQIAQLKSLILQKVDAILINAASPDALNPTIEQACKQGITVVVFDSLASAPCAYKLQDSIADYGYQEGKFVAQTMGGKGNVLMVRGVVGSEPEKVIYDNQLKALKQYPGIKIVRTVVGQASNSITQQAVGSALPSLPKIQGVITGGSSLGAVQAFQAANRPLPVVAFDNSGEALRFWQQQLAKNKGYKAVSVRTEPGQAAAAFWVAMMALQGSKPPKMVTLPNIVIEQPDLDAWTKVTPNGNVATWLWGRQQTEQAIQALRNDAKPKPLPVPDSAP